MNEGKDGVDSSSEVDVELQWRLEREQMRKAEAMQVLSQNFILPAEEKLPEVLRKREIEAKQKALMDKKIEEEKQKKRKEAAKKKERKTLIQQQLEKKKQVNK